MGQAGVSRKDWPVSIPDGSIGGEVDPPSRDVDEFGGYLGVAGDPASPPIFGGQRADNAFFSSVVDPNGDGVGIPFGEVGNARSPKRSANP